MKKIARLPSHVAIIMDGNGRWVERRGFPRPDGHKAAVDNIHRVIDDRITTKNIDDNSFNSYLYTAGLPDVDLIIRTGGELRISNFLLWQAAYSEYYFTNVPWPDFSERDVDTALLAYSRWQRRFGGLQHYKHA